MVGDVGEEPFGTTLHDGEEHAVLGPVVVVDGAERHAGFVDDPGDRRRFEPFGGHHLLGGVEHALARLHSASVRRHGFALVAHDQQPTPTL